MNLIRKYILLLILSLGVSVVSAQSVIPIPQHMEKKSGRFVLSGNTKLYTNLKGKERKILTDYLSALPIKFEKGSKKDSKNVLSLLLENPSKLLENPSRTQVGETSESYTLDVTTDQVKITASTSAGLFYGLQSLLQLAELQSDRTYQIGGVHITDAPRFAYRGFMLDVSRHFFSKEFVKKQIDALAYFKLNRLHLHLTDAAGWRIEIKKYPQLTNLAAWRSKALWKDWWNGDRKYTNRNEPGAYGGYYTQDDIRELVEYARIRHITIIPEIEMPGHSEETLAAYPNLSCAGEAYKNADFCAGNEETFVFLENVLKEVMDLFPSKYIHIGGDEAGKAAWKTCPKCQKRIKDEQLKDVHELQSYLIHRMEKFLNKHGRNLLGWDEILEGGLAPNATVMSWRGESGGIQAVRSGHQAIMTPGGYCYFDSYQDAPSLQPEAIGGYLTLEKVYSYNPVPDSLSAAEAKLIYGVQANLWTEYVPTEEHAEYMTYPRLLALAEVAWSAPERKSWPDFRKRVEKANATLASKGYAPFDLSKEVGRRPECRVPVNHLAVGKKVTYNAPYSESYVAQKETTLTDGHLGDWTYGDGAWQGFVSSRGLDVTIDLEKDTEIQSISGGFMETVGPGVFFPAEVIISVSSDGVNYTELKNERYVIGKSTKVEFKTISWEGTSKARYIRYQAHPSKETGGFIFADEIIVKGR